MSRADRQPEVADALRELQANGTRGTGDDQLERDGEGSPAVTDSRPCLRRCLARAGAGKSLNVEEAVVLLQARGSALDELMTIAAARS